MGQRNIPQTYFKNIRKCNKMWFRKRIATSRKRTFRNIRICNIFPQMSYRNRNTFYRKRNVPTANERVEPTRSAVDMILDMLGGMLFVFGFNLYMVNLILINCHWINLIYSNVLYVPYSAHGWNHITQDQSKMNWDRIHRTNCFECLNSDTS